MRWLFILALGGCGGFELETTVRAERGTLTVDGVPTNAVYGSYSYASYADAVRQPPTISVTDATGAHDLALSVVVCGPDEAWDHADVTYVLHDDGGRILIGVVNASCTAGDKGHTVVVD